MIYSEDEYLMLSGLQHFVFCRRQWALIHIENQWEENFRTTDGQIMHKKAHDESIKESRKDFFIVRGIRVSSPTLGITGQCDVVEYHMDPEGVSLVGREGKWRPYPIEYKRGSSKSLDADRLQLCAQAMCLEEMLCCDIPEGALFYGEDRRRERVFLTAEMREQVRGFLSEMHQYFRRGYTPKVKRSKSCNACSLKDLCLPQLMKTSSVSSYMDRVVEDAN